MARKTLTPKGFDFTESVDIDNRQTQYRTFLESENKSPETIRTYFRGLQSFDRWLTNSPGAPTIMNATEETVRTFIAALGKTHAATTVVTYWSGLRAFYSWASDKGYVAVNPMTQIKKPHAAPPEIPNIPIDSVRKMINVCNPAEFNGVRDRAIIALLFSTGMRRGELVGLTIHSYDRKTHQLVVLGKGSKYRIIAIDESTRPHLNAYLRIRSLHGLASTTESLWLGKRGPLNGTAIGQLLTRRAKSAGVDAKINPHTWRHTYSHNYLNQGGSVDGLMANAGWARMAMVERYAKAERATRAAKEQTNLNLGGLI